MDGPNGSPGDWPITFTSDREYPAPKSIRSRLARMSCQGQAWNRVAEGQLVRMRCQRGWGSTGLHSRGPGAVVLFGPRHGKKCSG